MGIFSKPKPPKPIDVGNVAGTTVAYNRIGQTDPFGNSLAYRQTGTDAQGNPTFDAVQKLGDIGEFYKGGLAGLGSQYFNLANNYLNNPDQLSSNAAFDKAYQFADANLEPRFEQTRAATENRLRNQGLDPTSESYRTGMNDLALQQNEARNNLVTGLQGQMFNQGLSGLGALTGLANPGMQFGNVAMGPQYVTPPQVDIAGLTELQQKQLQSNYDAKMKGVLGGLGGLGSVVGTIGGAILGGPIGASIGGSLFGGGPMGGIGGGG